MNVSSYQTDVLFLLVGTNPLPNYVSVSLLAKEYGTVYLLHTDTTLMVAERLRKHIEEDRSDLTLIPCEVSKSDPQRIEQELQDLTRDLGPNAYVGLNYTGGSKPMAVQAYHTLHTTYPRGIYSYLDADTLSLIIETPGLPLQRVFVGREVKVNFETLFDLHHYETTSIRREAKQIELCRSLADVHMSSQGMREWYVWRRTLSQLDPLLPNAEKYPTLRPVVEVLTDLGQGHASPETGVAEALGFTSLRSCTSFFKGQWLEEYAFDALASQADVLELEDWGIGIEPQKQQSEQESQQRQFEIDIAAILGYQLFAISCMVTEKRAKAKEHLLEVFVRARQISGDEARFGVVCFVNDHQALESEVTEEWDARGKIRVFGRDHIPDLGRHFHEWIITASQIR